MAQVDQELNEESRQRGRRLEVTGHVSGHATQTFDAEPGMKLEQVMAQAAALAGVALLPPRSKPFDRLHEMHGEQVGPVIENLDQTLGEYLRQSHRQPHFTVELALTIHVNTRWDVALRDAMSPREILALPRIHLDPAKYTLYLPESTQELPPDTPITLSRGMDLEAQPDGKYGGGN
jgi:hypothetical protein